MADTTSDKTTRFFKTQRSSVDFMQNGDRLLLANNLIGIEIRKLEQGFQLTRLYGIKDGQDFLANVGKNQPNLFEIVTCLDPAIAYRTSQHRTTSYHAMKSGGYEVMDEMAGETWPVGPTSMGRTRFYRTGDGRESTLHMVWEQVDLKDEPGAMDITVSVTLKKDGPFSYWRIGLKNRSRNLGVERVKFPIINLAPIGKAGDNVFIYPQDRGRMVQNPFDQPLGFGDNLHIRSIYPSNIGMQFEALYNERTGTGIFLGTQDPTPNMMDWQVVNAKKYVSWRPGHFPPNIGYANQDFDLPYDCVVGPFKGDWWDASQIYRQWALKQSWCSKGTLTQRQDIPTWLKESPLFLTANSEGRDDLVAATRDHYMKYLDFAGVPIACTWYTWKDYKPELTTYQTPYCFWRVGLGRVGAVENIHDGNYPGLPAVSSFAEASRQLREKGGMVNPYVCVQIYDQGPSENAPYVDEARPHIARDAFGYMLGFNYETSWRPCVWPQWWHDRMKETVVELMKNENAMGAYLDVMHGCSKPCYWTHHGHTACGGSSMTVGMHKLSKYIRDAVKELDPEAITTGEDSTENMIDVIDGKLYQATLRPTSGPPIFAAVYNEYMTRHGIETSAETETMFVMQAASLFVEGSQIGRLYLEPWRISEPDLGVCLSFERPEHRNMVEFLGSLVSYYKVETSREFLCYGQLMRPVKFVSPSPMPTVSYDVEGTAYKRNAVTLPALMSGVFRSDNGELGIFLVNAGANTLTYDADFDLKDRGMTLPVNVTQIAADGGTREYTSAAKDKLRLKGSLPPRGVTFIHVR